MGSDGSQGIYHFVSLATRDRRPYLSERHVLVTQAIESLSRLPGVRVEYSRVLSDHIQLILALTASGLEVGELVRRLKASTNRRSGVRLWEAHHYHRTLPDDDTVRRVRELVSHNPFVERLDWDDL